MSQKAQFREKYNVNPQCPRKYSKGKSELRRHYRRETHLRKDQRWQYEHLSARDPNTDVVHHRVRDKDGVLPSYADLQKELPLFIDAEL